MKFHSIRNSVFIIYIKSSKTISFLCMVSIKSNLPLSVLKFWKRFELPIFYWTIHVVNICLILTLKETIWISNFFWFFKSSISWKQTRKANSWNNVIIMNLRNQRFFVDTSQAFIHVIIAPGPCIIVDLDCCLNIIVLILLNLEMFKI